MQIFLGDFVVAEWCVKFSAIVLSGNKSARVLFELVKMEVGFFLVTAVIDGVFWEIGKTGGFREGIVDFIISALY